MWTLSSLLTIIITFIIININYSNNVHVYRWCNLPGFTASNIYLLGGQESLNRDVHPSSPGPTLIDYYLPDNDRHLSGLSCYAKDHLRNAIEWDHDITKLQHRQNKYDILTDSESDNEDAYGDYKPSMQRVRMLLKPPPPKVKVEASITSDTKGKKSSSSTTKGKESSAVKSSNTTASATVVDNDNILDNNNLDTFSAALLHEDERKEEQVELLSDRKILEMESTILKTRRKKVEDFTDRLVELPLLPLLLLRLISHAFMYIRTVHTCILIYICMLACIYIDTCIFNLIYIHTCIYTVAYHS